jgi:molybdopterin-guanine dinucleotide biosynthesis protein A
MNNRFAEMDCFVLAGGKSNQAEDFQPAGELTRLEKGYRRYAAVFEKVKLVLKKDQATERYLNYPHICDDSSDRGAVFGIAAALKQSESDAVFIGSSDIADFPLQLAAELVKNYDGELFLGYGDDSSQPGKHQPLFGVFSKRLVDHLEAVGLSMQELSRMLLREGRLMPLPPGVPADRLGLG